MPPKVEKALDPDPLLSTTEVGELFDVHPSTVKRWCDRGELECDRTDGGHRRIPLSQVLGRARSFGEPLPLLGFGGRAGRTWEAARAARDGDFEPGRRLALDCLERDALGPFADLLVHLGRDRRVDLRRLLDEGLRPVMESVGRRWESGEVRVGEEHQVSEIVTGALHRLRRAPEPGGAEGSSAPVALVGCVEGERHVLGARCVRLVLERAGWRVRFLGADVPMEEWGALARIYGAGLICISFSRLRRRGDLMRCLRRLAEDYEPENPYALALGGGASLDGPVGEEWPFTAVGFFPATVPFTDWLGESGHGG